LHPLQSHSNAFQLRSVKRILAEEPVSAQITRRYPPYHQISDPTERRLAIIRLHSEGWNKQSIAGYLVISRETVHVTLRRWIEEGVYGLDDKSHARKPGVRKVDLRTMAIVRELQENPELGEFRVHAALRQLGIDLSPRTCGRILALNRRLYGLRGPARTEREPKPIVGSSTGPLISAISTTASMTSESIVFRSWRITAAPSWPVASRADRTSPPT
jgi:transposase